MRYRKHVSLSLHELSQLLTAWNKFAVNPDKLGEHVLGESYPDLIKQLDVQCEIKLTLPQLYNLVWYYKHSVLERLRHLHKKLPSNYNYLLKRVANQCPELFEQDADGEWKMKESKEILGVYENERD